VQDNAIKTVKMWSLEKIEATQIQKSLFS